VEGLVDEIVGTDADAKIHRFACRIAEAQLDLQRVWHARHQFLSEKLNEPYYESRTSRRAKVNLICRILGLNLPKNIMALLTKFITTTPQGEDKFALILSQEAQWLLRLDRYERRALSRRKFAIREFDAECREEKRNRL